MDADGQTGPRWRARGCAKKQLRLPARVLWKSSVVRCCFTASTPTTHGPGMAYFPPPPDQGGGSSSDQHGDIGGPGRDRPAGVRKDQGGAASSRRWPRGPPPWPLTAPPPGAGRAPARRQPRERQHQLIAPLAFGQRVDLVDDHALEAGEGAPRILVGGQESEAFGRGKQDMRRVGALALLARRWRVAGSGPRPGSAGPSR